LKWGLTLCTEGVGATPASEKKKDPAKAKDWSRRRGGRKRDKYGRPSERAALT